MSSLVKGSDDTARYVRKKVNDTEQNTNALTLSLTSYLKGQEKLRGRRLEMALALKSFSESEPTNLSTALINTAEALVDMEEFRKYMHDRMESKANEPLKQYKGICSSIKTEINAREAAVLKEQKKQAELERLSVKEAGNRSKIAQCQMELDNATQNLVHVNSALAGHVERFQARKIEDVKTVLNEMIYSEMQYHAKSLEILTNLQASICNMDYQEDLNELADKFQVEKSADISSDL